MKTLNELGDEFLDNARKHGFYDEEMSKEDIMIPNFIANIHSEVSELWDAFCHQRMHEPCEKSNLMKNKLTCAEEELADILIYALGGARLLNIDIDRAIDIKSSYNANRPILHEGKRK